MEAAMNKQSSALRIAVADDEPDILRFFHEFLPKLGHEVVAEAETGRQLADRCRATHPDLVITDVTMPDMDGFRAAEEINRDRLVPVILITGRHQADMLARAEASYIMAYLTKPAKPVDLEAAINLAMLRFGQFETLRLEAHSLRQALEDRKIIERAKEIVSRRLRLDEAESFRRLRKVASDTNRKLVEMARLVLEADEIYQSLER